MAKVTSYDLLRNDILKKDYKPIYLLMGEESFFIDDLTDLLEQSILTETERDFNYSLFYGVDSDVRNIITACKRYPMMSKYQVVIVKEAQRLDRFEMLENYAKQPLHSTILIINYKHGTVDGRKSVVKAIDKVGIIFESKRLYENRIPAFISSYYRERGFNIDDKSTQMLVDYVGNDLSKMVKELEKLQVVLSGKQPRITPEVVEENIGISKDYNNFELVKAIAKKDDLHAYKIVDYFDKNQKDHPLVMVLFSLFYYFNNLLECFWLPNKSEQAVMKTLNLRSTFMTHDYMFGLRNYNVKKVMEIISHLRTFDAKSKGIDNPPYTTNGELLKELVYIIMH
ncbi:MAG: DNA polymerase III subunit delta [Dysgonamonadaceae bacterium]|nr:DNA polymerase III subunit delta [Dysgonamonadaceae bacterium]MDD4728804.1 DNA polymerase III subunit delta [Dysgonamonadaceae bacterium]